jgi:hypothetical protein
VVVGAHDRVARSVEFFDLRERILLACSWVVIVIVHVTAIIKVIAIDNENTARSQRQREKDS